MVSSIEQLEKEAKIWGDSKNGDPPYPKGTFVTVIRSNPVTQIKSPWIFCKRPPHKDEKTKNDVVDAFDGTFSAGYIPVVEYGWYFEHRRGFAGPFGTYEECLAAFESQK